MEPGVHEALKSLFYDYDLSVEEWDSVGANQHFLVKFEVNDNLQDNPELYKLIETVFGAEGFRVPDGYTKCVGGKNE